MTDGALRTSRYLARSSEFTAYVATWAPVPASGGWVADRKILAVDV
jgi:hypothetical protein